MKKEVVLEADKPVRRQREKRKQPVEPTEESDEDLREMMSGVERPPGDDGNAMAAADEELSVQETDATPARKRRKRGTLRTPFTPDEDVNLISLHNSWLEKAR